MSPKSMCTKGLESVGRGSPRPGRCRSRRICCVVVVLVSLSGARGGVKVGKVGRIRLVWCSQWLVLVVQVAVVPSPCVLAVETAVVAPIQMPKVE